MSSHLRYSSLIRSHQNSHKKPKIAALFILSIIAIGNFSLLFTDPIAYASDTEGSKTAATGEKVFEEHISEQINIRKSSVFAPILVHISSQGESYTLLTYAHKVQDIFADARLPYKEIDQFSPSLDQTVSNGTRISHVSIEKFTQFEDEEVAYKVEYHDDANIEYGQEQVVQQGTNGVFRRTYQLIYADGEFAEKREVSADFILPVLNKIIAKGTKLVPKYLALDDGTTFEYCTVKRVWLTAYDPFCTGCSGRGITALGAKLKKGIVAVDPKVIPMRSWMYVPGYGLGQAMDVGGGVKGNHVDLGFESPEQRMSLWGGSRYGEAYLACPAH